MENVKEHLLQVLLRECLAMLAPQFLPQAQRMWDVLRSFALGKRMMFAHEHDLAYLVEHPMFTFALRKKPRDTSDGS